MSKRKLRGIGLIGLGALGGVFISLALTATAQRSGVEPLPLRELRHFASVFDVIKRSYVEPVTDQQLIDDAIRGMFTDLDPHSAYLDAEAFKEMESMTQGGFGGLGIEIGSEDGRPKVISPIEDTPAAKAGIMAGDVIMGIDGKSTQDMTLNEAIKLMRGEPQTAVTLSISRAGRDKPFDVTIVRDHIKVKSIRGKNLDNDILYVRVSQFQERTAADLVRQLQELSSGIQPRGLVLDLRNDPGGLLESAIGVTSAFVKPGDAVVSTKGRIPSSNREYFAKPLTSVLSELNSNGQSAQSLSWLQDIPMVVLVNAGSASASEIVAGALQDHKRATVIGTRTFGKGSVQSVVPLSPEVGIKLTTALYYTPNGRTIQVTGVDPDIEVDDTAQGNLFRIPREADLDRHLLNAGFDEDADKAKEVEFVEEPKMFEFGSEDDFQLQQAVNFLEGRPVKKSDPKATQAAKADEAGADKASQGDAKQNTNASTQPNSAAPAQKKTPVIEPGAVQRYRITPEGVVPQP